MKPWAEKQRQRVIQLADKWIKPLGLAWWARIEFRYYYKRAICAKKFAHDDERSALFIIYVDWRYLEAVIDVNLQELRQIEDDDRLEFYFIHEMMHVHLAELEVPEDMKPHEERVCTYLAEAFQWVSQGKG